MISYSRWNRLPADPSLSQRLKDALLVAVKRDPIDALQDAETLCQVLTERAMEVLDREELGGDVKEG